MGEKSQAKQRVIAIARRCRSCRAAERAELDEGSAKARALNWGRSHSAVASAGTALSRGNRGVAVPAALREEHDRLCFGVLASRESRAMERVWKVCW